MTKCNSANCQPVFHGTKAACKTRAEHVFALTHRLSLLSDEDQQTGPSYATSSLPVWTAQKASWFSPRPGNPQKHDQRYERQEKIHQSLGSVKECLLKHDLSIILVIRLPKNRISNHDIGAEQSIFNKTTYLFQVSNET